VLKEAPKFSLQVDLNGVFDSEDWEEDLAGIVRDAIRKTLDAAVRDAIRQDPNYPELLKTIKTRLYAAALKRVTVKDAMRAFGQ
jgi:hypothetical protein